MKKRKKLQYIDWLHYIEVTRFNKIAIQAKAEMSARDGLEASPCMLNQLCTAQLRESSSINLSVSCPDEIIGYYVLKYERILSTIQPTLLFL